MRFRSHKKINIALALSLICYSLLAIGHFGHDHTYGQAEPGYCTTQCDNSEHFDAKPLCKGFPVDLTLGIIQDNLVSEITFPVFLPESIRSDYQVVSSAFVFKDQSRAPPLG